MFSTLSTYDTLQDTGMLLRCKYETLFAQKNPTN